MSEPRSVYRIVDMDGDESYVVARDWNEAIRTWKRQEVLNGSASEVGMADEPETITLLGDAIEAKRI